MHSPAHEAKATKSNARLLQQTPEDSATDRVGQRAGPDPLSQLMRCSGDVASPSAHAAALVRLKASSPATAQRSVLQLQKRYGNRYVQRVLAIARQGEIEAGVAPEIERAINSARGSGQALDSGARTRMESAFGADFSSVRVHTGARADSLNRSLSARAFTTGQDIFFRQGEYNPGSSAGQELLAHELTHVVQQSGAGVQGKLTVSQPGDALEREADGVAHSVMQGLQRQPMEEEEEELPISARQATAGSRLVGRT